MPDGTCIHITALTDIKRPARHVCEECVKTKARWLHLRTCQSCGQTHCCDSSPSRHARWHAMETGHVVIASAEPGESWIYCFEDDSFADLFGDLVGTDSGAGG